MIDLKKGYSMKKRNIFKKGAFSLTDIGIGIVLLGIIIGSAYIYLSGTKDDLLFKNNMQMVYRTLHEGMTNYKDGSYLGRGTYKDANTENVLAFMKSDILSRENESDAFLTPMNSLDLKGFVKIEVAAATDNKGNENRRYKVYFDLSDYAEARGWSPEQSGKAENDIANFFLTVSPDAKISGTATAIGSPNSNTTVSNPNSDGKILVDNIK